MIVLVSLIVLLRELLVSTRSTMYMTDFKDSYAHAHVSATAPVI